MQTLPKKKKKNFMQTNELQVIGANIFNPCQLKSGISPIPRFILILELFVTPLFTLCFQPQHHHHTQQHEY